MDNKPEFSHIVQLSELGGRPLEIDLIANPQELAALKKRLIVEDIESFKAHVSLILLKNSDVNMTASFSAQVRQSCGVTLKPIVSEINYEFSITYRTIVEEEDEEEDEVFEDFENFVEPPDPLIDEKIDVGEALVEQLALEIDPFPRVKGAVFEGYVAGSEVVEKAYLEKKNPFAVLSKLKLKKDNKD